MTARYPDFDGTQVCATVDVEAFFPELGESCEAAKALCKPCAFRDACLSYALHHNVAGVWGGTSDNQRRIMRRVHGIVARPIGIGEIVCEARKPVTS